MPGYIQNSLQKFQQEPLEHPQYTPHPWNKPVYGKYIQLDTQQISVPKLNSADTSCVQYINDIFLYYSRAVDPTIIPDLNKISTCQYAPTQDTMKKCNQMLDNALTHPNATIQCYASDMILLTDIYAVYLVLPEDRSHIAGHYYFTNRIFYYSKDTPTPNGPILTE